MSNVKTNAGWHGHLQKNVILDISLNHWTWESFNICVIIMYMVDQFINVHLFLSFWWPPSLNTHLKNLKWKISLDVYIYVAITFTCAAMWWGGHADQTVKVYGAYGAYLPICLSTDLSKIVKHSLTHTIYMYNTIYTSVCRHGRYI